MGKYSLCYLKNDSLISIYLKRLDFFKDKDEFDIKNIDSFTMQFYNELDLKEYLINNNILPEGKYHLAIALKKKINNEYYNKPIYDSDRLFFTGDKNIITCKYVLEQFRRHMLDGNFMYAAALNYEEKYQHARSRIKGSSIILKVVNIIKNISKKITKSGVNSLSKYEIEIYTNSINLLLDFELYKGELKIVNSSRIFEVKKDDSNKNIINYRGLRDIVNLIKKINEKTIESLCESRNNIINCSEEQFGLNRNTEEFLTHEDFKDINKKLSEDLPSEIKDSLDYYTDMIIKKH